MSPHLPLARPGAGHRALVTLLGSLLGLLLLGGPLSAWAGPPAALLDVAPQAPALPVVTQGRLSGGAGVHVIERPALPLQRVELRVGWAGLEAPAADQLAAGLVGEVLRGGTRQRSGAELAQALDRLGASWDLGMSLTHLWAWVELPVEGVDQALALLAEAVLESRYARGPARRHRARWASWLEDLSWDLRRVHRRAENHAWYPPGHPSRITSQPQDLRQLSLGRVRPLVERVLAQGQADLIASGALSAEALLPLLEARFGGLQGTQPAVAAPPARPRAALWLVGRSGFDAALVTVMLPGLARTHPDTPLAELLVELLASAFTSRLSLDLRERRGLTYGVSGELEQGPLDGRVLIYLEAPTERAVEALVAIHGHLDALAGALADAAGAVQPDELRRAQRSLLFNAGVQLSSNAGAARWLGGLVGWGLDPGLETARWQALLQATPTDLHRVAAQLCARAGRVSVLTGDREVLEAQLLAAGLAPDRLISARALATGR